MYAQYTRYTGHRNRPTIKKKAYTRRLTNALPCLTLRNRPTIATPINSNKFTEFETKKQKF